MPRHVKPMPMTRKTTKPCALCGWCYVTGDVFKCRKNSMNFSEKYAKLHHCDSFVEKEVVIE